MTRRKSALLLLTVFLLGVLMSGLSMMSVSAEATTYVYEYRVKADTDVCAFEGTVSYPENLNVSSVEILGAQTEYKNDSTNRVVKFNSTSGADTIDATEGATLVTVTFALGGNADNIDFSEITTNLTNFYTAEQATAATVSNVAYEYTNVVDDATLSGGHADIDTPANSSTFPKLEINNKSLTLYDNLAINFKVNRTYFTDYGYTDPYIVCEFNGNEYTLEHNDKLDTTTQYVFQFDKIAPYMMNDSAKVTLYATNGGMLCKSEVLEYGVIDYCNTILSRYTYSQNPELLTLIVDLLNYGAMSQVYNNYNTDSLVNAALTSTQQGYATQEVPAVKNIRNKEFVKIDNPTVTWGGAGLFLSDAVNMRLSFSAASYDNVTLKVKFDNETYTYTKDDFGTYNGSKCLYFNMLTASQFSQPADFTFYDANNTAISDTYRFSVDSYIALIKQSYSEGDLVNLLNALAKYGSAAKAYVG